MATIKKRKGENYAFELSSPEETISNDVVVKLSYALSPVLNEIKSYLSNQNDLMLSLNTKIDKLNLNLTIKISKLEAQFYKLEKEISDMQIHILHGTMSCAQMQMTETPYTHY